MEHSPAFVHDRTRSGPSRRAAGGREGDPARPGARARRDAPTRPGAGEARGELGGEGRGTSPGPSPRRAPPLPLSRRPLGSPRSRPRPPFPPLSPRSPRAPFPPLASPPSLLPRSPPPLPPRSSRTPPSLLPHSPLAPPPLPPRSSPTPRPARFLRSSAPLRCSVAGAADPPARARVHARMRGLRGALDSRRDRCASNVRDNGSRRLSAWSHRERRGRHVLLRL